MIVETDKLIEEIRKLKEENLRLRNILEKHGISVENTLIREPVAEMSGSESMRPENKNVTSASVTVLSLDEKVALFRSVFRGREDVFARRWFSQTSGKSGYQPVCTREWNQEYCDKKKYKCAECPNREFQPLGYNDIYSHLEGRDPYGKDVIGLYAIMPDNTCNFLCTDFDDKSCENGYKNDVRAFVSVCHEWNIPAYIERSRSGNGAHVWIIFAESVRAKTARLMGNAILTEAMDRDGHISFKSYDRFFPNQDFMPQGGFGNLVALPLQGQARKKGNSVFVDDDFNVIPDQWGFLRQMRKMSAAEAERIVALHSSEEPMGSLSRSSESAPWEKPLPKPMTRADFPTGITIVRSSGLYIPIKDLHANVINHLKRLAAFKNPEFYAKLGMRLPVYNLPRIISCSELSDDYLWLPRGCEDAVMEFFHSNNVTLTIEDKTNPGKTINIEFQGKLYPEQEAALNDLGNHSCGTLHATTAFGKTVVAIGMIARKKVNTLILVHTKALLDQWRGELGKFLATDFQPVDAHKGRGRRKKFQQFGALSSTEDSLNGKIDIALLQSCMTDNEVKPFVRDYGMVIVDECHHAPAVNFERVLKEVNARYVYGLTATPIRKDGHQPIIFMQCGEIRHTVSAKAQQEQQTFQRLLIPRFTSYRQLEKRQSYSQIMPELLENEARNKLIMDDVAKVIEEGRTPIILTERTAHVDILMEECKKICPNVIRLIGNDSAKTKRETLQNLKEIPANEPLIVVATGRYIGEGFDLPRLDTLMLALPVSWKGLIAQYTGRLHRNYPGKTEVRIYDYVDLRVPVLESMYRKRLHGYKSVGYSIGIVNEGLFSDSVPEAIYDSDSYEKPFINDLVSAKRSIVISTYRLRWKHRPRIIDLLAAAMLRGVCITIIISEPGHQEEELQQMGIIIISRPDSKITAAVIDQSLGWYGNVNFIGRPFSDTNVIRLADPNFATTLLDSIMPE